MTTTEQAYTINGFAPSGVTELVAAIQQDAAQAQMAFHATTAWVDGTRSLTRMTSFDWAGQPYARNFSLTIDEPEELGGTNMGPNPQEVLLAGVNSCILTTFVEHCSLEGIRLEKVEIHSTGTLDVRGLLKLDESIQAGYQDMRWTLTVKGDATPEKFQQMYEATIASSPNFWNLANPVKIVPSLQVEA
ncbi:OsmC family protein [Nodosilinea sp. FACHB-131]|uniref:OsmC family protein n=1 Tax=Cyanophyceae TaxID=3028117 RepID=UPI001684FAB9|nr:OsmC family protein [Nodosilinea sp. FACHB-131]MBD1876097.1 OsmC family protein [Nodosilinea sp. FACHB-131]